MPIVIKIKDPSLRREFISKASVMLSKKMNSNILPQHIEHEMELYENGKQPYNTALYQDVVELLKMVYEKKRMSNQ